MASFSQFLTSWAKNPTPRQITWVCGSEPILVEEVVRMVTEAIGPTWNLVHLSAGQDPERAVWAALDQHPMGASPRLVVVRHADKLTNWDRFVQWVKRRGLNSRTYVIMVSDEERVPRTEVTRQQKRRGAKAEVLPHVACIGSRGHVVECRPFTTATSARALEWVRARAPMRENVAKHLLTRSGWNLRLVRDICTKLAVFPGEPSVLVVNALLDEYPQDSLTDALMALDRKSALLAARRLDPGELSSVIGLLDAKLDTAAMLHQMQSNRATNSEMARELGNLAFMLGDLLKVAKHYNAARVTQTRKVLAVADEAVRSGHTTGVLESVIALW